jgi:tetratricopeptide (TPR) repeat protein
MNKISNLIENKDWHAITNQFEPKILTKGCSFKEGMALTYRMLFNEERDDGLSNYAVQLLEEIRQFYPKEWSLDWKNDVFLGDACYITMRYEEQYKAYKRAFEKANPPPASLLISLAGCYLMQEPPITLDEAENLSKKALEKEISVEGVVLLRGIYAEKKEQAKFDYWDNILQEVQKKNIHTQNTWPDFSEDSI